MVLITELSENNLSALTNLESFHIKMDSVRSMPEKLFEHQHKLQKLRIETKVLQNLHPKLFKPLNSLKKLYLEIPTVIQIPENIFKYLKQLAHIHLHFSVENLPLNLFKNTTKLTEVHLSREWMISRHTRLLHPSPFDRIENLHRLNLSHIIMVDFPPNWFKPITNITSLTLNNCGLRSLKSGNVECLETLMRLNYLNLDSNFLRQLTSNNFKYNFDLESLIISNNRVQLIEQNTFVNLKKLQLLDLGENFRFSTKVFRNLPNLRNLRIKGNSNIEFKDNSFSNLSQLTYLDLSSNLELKITKDSFSGNYLIIFFEIFLK